MPESIKLHEIFGISNDKEFEKIALRIFYFQKEENPVYKNYLQQINKYNFEPQSIKEIPFLPISFFKNQKVLCKDQKVEIEFTSSGTNGVQSHHYVTDKSVYEASYLNGFQHFYGNPSDFTILALLPSYMESEGSSLIYMVENLIQKSNSSLSGFYLDNFEDLTKNLRQALESDKKIILLGVSFALLDLSEKYQLDLSKVIIMETGGMKGKRKELIRGELHALFSASFNCENIHSEYGMTELLSQAYSKGNGIFECPPWMKVLFRDTYDPFSLDKSAGGVNVIDLANINSCSFIETSDLGRFVDGGFEILGRLDNSDIRGCNLMIN